MTPSGLFSRKLWASLLSSTAVSIVMTPPVVFVTGATRGLGRAIASLFASQGASLGLISRHREQAQQLGALLPLNKDGQSNVGVGLDVSDAAEVREGFALLEKTLGTLLIPNTPLFCPHVHPPSTACLGPADVLVNCAGISRDKLLIKLADEELDEVWGSSFAPLFIDKLKP
jgi:NAD(P)-dependent dehydrogenase (short-subunit alcohol dehydrogenase family)